MNSPILLPAMALVAWTFVMWAWLYATSPAPNSNQREPSAAMQDFA